MGFTPFDLQKIGIDKTGSGGGSIVDTYSRVKAGTTDGTTLEVLPLFFNEDQQALKIFFLNNWITLAQVSFDSLWNSLTDEWDSTSMSWDSPLT
jgi:hypothetical protein